MVLIGTTLTPEELWFAQEREQIIRPDDVLILSTSIKSKNINRDWDLYRFCRSLEWCSYYYDKTLYLNFMTNRYYWRSDLHNKIFPNYAYCSMMAKVPEDVMDIIKKEKYPRLENRLFTEKDLKEAFNKLKECNFKEKELYIIEVGKRQ